MDKSDNKSPWGMFDPCWDLIDPHPDIYSLFTHFDQQFFKNKLTGVQVAWSNRMTSCAGICYFYPKNSECIIRLSAPLLKLRTRKDLIETLLHEMIHAYLFVTNNNSDREDHGPLFCSHMERINIALGANVTVYHTFSEEVDLYKVHVWRCDGPCRLVAPYFGLVKRAMNRPPGKNDLWWESHQNKCHGKFTKVAGPKTQAELKEEAKSRKKLGQGSKTDAKLHEKPKVGGPCATVTSGALMAMERSELDDKLMSENQEKPKGQTSDGAGKYYSIFKTINIPPQMAECPVCTVRVPLDTINSHLDEHYMPTGGVKPKVGKCIVCGIEFSQKNLGDHQKICLEEMFSGEDVGNEQTMDMECPSTSDGHHLTGGDKLRDGSPWSNAWAMGDLPSAEFRGNNSLVDNQADGRVLGKENWPFEGESRPSGNGVLPFGGEGRRLGSDGMPFGGEGIPLGNEVRSFGGEGIPLGNEVRSFGVEGIPSGSGVRPFGGEGIPVDREGRPLGSGIWPLDTGNVVLARGRMTLDAGGNLVESPARLLGDTPEEPGTFGTSLPGMPIAFRDFAFDVVDDTDEEEVDAFVKCPVCMSAVLESKINEHLDQCITK